MHYDELFARRLVIGSTDERAPRAVIEATNDAVRITLRGNRRRPPLLLEARSNRPPRILIGESEHGPSLEIEPQGILVWMNGNVVAALRSRAEGGALDLCDLKGRPVRSIPKRPG